MRRCFDRYVRGRPLPASGELVILDVGGADVNGNYIEIFRDVPNRYLVADVQHADGVSIVLDDPYRIPLDDASVDIVVSGQMLEHCEFFWLSFAEMMRVLKPQGYLFLIAPSAGPIHRYPVDCYRFYPDAYRALAKYANCRLIEVWQDKRGPWYDLVGVFARHSAPEVPASVPKPIVTYDPDTSPPSSLPEEEATRGDMSYLDFLERIHRLLQPSQYLEIGVRLGDSLRLARCPAVGVDPAPRISVPLGEQARVLALTSDQFFEDAAQTLSQPPDLVFIDGMHLFEFALRDFMNVERLAAPGGLVVIDDVFPCHSAQAERKRRTRVWTGDVWKLHACLKQYRPDLLLMAADTSPTGMLLVAGLAPENDLLWSQYNPIVREFVIDDPPVPAEVLKRAGSVPAGDPRLDRVIETIAECRSTPLPPGELARRLRLAATE